MLKTLNMRIRFILNLLFLNVRLIYTFRIPHFQWIMGVILHMLKVPYLLEKGGGIPHLGGQIIKVLGSEGVSMYNSSMMF